MCVLADDAVGYMLFFYILLVFFSHIENVAPFIRAVRDVLSALPGKSQDALSVVVDSHIRHLFFHFQ